MLYHYRSIESTDGEGKLSKSIAETSAFRFLSELERGVTSTNGLKLFALKETTVDVRDQKLKQFADTLSSSTKFGSQKSVKNLSAFHDMTDVPVVLDWRLYLSLDEIDAFVKSAVPDDEIYDYWSYNPIENRSDFCYIDSDTSSSLVNQSWLVCYYKRRFEGNAHLPSGCQGGENQLNEAIGLDACTDERWDATHRIKQMLKDLTRGRDVFRATCGIHS
ncbi:hypothetical protein TIFTF001_042214 [Ficus carica]|uniref:Uncharacterized protein n=1 Tax=Ficus carica TaxID=3494 RepID=A0AA87ZLA6_FICCA|nr:hypothetical protein TIFTF001_042214 [Ficus carica]